MSAQFEIIAKAVNMTGESPSWSASEQRLYWVDITDKKVYRWHETTGVQHWDTPQMAGCLMQHADGSFKLFQEDQISKLVFRQDELSIETTQQIQHPHPHLRFNDGCVDRQGRAWIGSMHIQNNGSLVGTLYCAENEQLHSRIEGLATPNGLAFSPDGRTMYLSDSHPSIQKIWAFDYDTDDGQLSNQRIFVDMQQYSGRPDGATVDTDGCYWICAIDSGCVLRFSPQGELLMQYQLPISKPSKCIFGGRDLKTLFVTSLKPEHANEFDGSVFAIQTPYQGIHEAQVKR
ncbi:SMP-30/gluconolactonase/LRE family protein [Acinetobacter sp. MD2(2019)]|uniref:SMP-30/gluconolactonase/LRE family protein n=1 Tax=Acinetobacter sp. MD2(2019) TaxID=2605273 RepID=UPI002D1F51AF|nr:SMP-30/gluconolactonase/LRE family protein [Acinetobacter sp. MD2(2019)]MEB3754153.1 SMP-30/gluconolactonase/LRE family protein [Acinetobacter sp. MD2(2019)]